jgi:demethylmenaquinone methyltransferase/2-methoxy-6-polyprenyl-1,4-benzoquinol methylase
MWDRFVTVTGRECNSLLRELFVTFSTVESRFYQPDEHRAEKVRELFGAIARRYDLLNDIMSAGLHRCWKRRLVERGVAASVTDAMSDRRRDGGRYITPQVLDLCCGTGDIAWLFARQGASVTAVDFTEEMLRVARARAPQSSNTPALQHSISFVHADALQLPFPDGSFDVVSVGYGLRNLADLERGLREVLRVLRPGGKLVSLDFGKPRSRVLRFFYFGYLRIVLPVLGRVFCGDPDTHGYILASLQSYPAQEGTKKLMEECGFTGCGFEEFVGGTMAINFGSKPG